MFGKKTYGMTWVAAVLLLASAGCVQIEPVSTFSDIPMSFSTYTPRLLSKAGETLQPGTKAAPNGAVTDATVPANSSFGVFAWYQPGVIGSSTGHWTDGGWTPNFMYNQEVTYNGTAYSYSPTRYWPANDENTISFWAYWPYEVYNASNTGTLKFYTTDALNAAYSNAATTGLPVATYTVDPANQYDLMFDGFTNRDRTYTNGAGSPGEVPLNFRHALALVEFQIAEGTGAHINSLTISDLYWSGTCASPVSRSWTDQGDQDDYSISNVDVNSATICSLMMIPQTIDPSAELTINYDITYESSDPNHTEPIVYKGNSGSAVLTAAKNAQGGSANIMEWVAGGHYIYRITNSYDRIEFEGVVVSGDDWSVGNDNIPVSE